MNMYIFLLTDSDDSISGDCSTPKKFVVTAESSEKAHKIVRQAITGFEKYDLELGDKWDKINAEIIGIANVNFMKENDLSQGIICIERD